MNSKERILKSIRLEPVDHVPLYFRLWDMGSGIDQIPFNWRDQVKRAEHLLNIGLDDTLLLQPPLGYTEEYHAERSSLIEKVIIELEKELNTNKYPTVTKRYITPEGKLSQRIKITEDWPYGMDIMLFNDFNISRYLQPIIQTKDDISRLKYLLAEPTDSQLSLFHKKSDEIRKHAQRLGVAVDGGWSALGDSAIWLCGVNNIHYWQMDQPDILEKLLDVILNWELNRMQYLLDAGIDVMVHMAWYEGTDFWTPKIFQKLLKPRLKVLCETAHDAGIPFRYIITKGWSHILDDLIEIGIDCLTGIDPVQDNVSLEEISNNLGGRICLMGGMNAAVSFTSWTELEIQLAVQNAMETLGKNMGFILFPVDNFACEWPWDKAEIVIQQWKVYR